MNNDNELPDWVYEQLHLRCLADKKRYDARLAYLDGRNARAMVLNKEADYLDKSARKLGNSDARQS